MSMKYFLTGILFIIFFISSAQNLGIGLQQSKVYKMTTARVQNDYIIPDRQGGFITVSTKRSGFLANPLVFESYVNLYDEQMQPVKKITLKLNKGTVKGSIKGAFIDKRQLKLIKLESNLRKHYYAFKILSGDIAHGKNFDEKEFFRLNFNYPKNEVNLFVNLNSLYFEKLKYYSDVNFFNPKIFIKFSPQNRFFALIYKSIKTNNNLYKAVIFDNKFNKIFEKSFGGNIPKQLFKITDMLVSDTDGSVYITAAVYKNNPHKKRRFVNTDNLKNFMIYELRPDKQYQYSVKPKKVMEKLHLGKPANEDNEIYVFGFYRNRYIDLNDIDGIFRLNLTTHGLGLLTENYAPFKVKLVHTSYNKSHKNTKNHQMIVRKHYVSNNGDWLINSEDFYIPLMMKRKDREASVSEIVGDIFSIKISKQGNIYWSKKIFKQQVVKPRLALHSYFSTLINGNNYILFTDSKLKKQTGKEPFYLNNKDLQNLNGIKISNSGNTDIEIVKENKKSKFRFMPIEGIMINKNQAVIPAKDHQYIKFYKLNFK